MISDISNLSSLAVWYSTLLDFLLAEKLDGSRPCAQSARRSTRSASTCRRPPFSGYSRNDGALRALDGRQGPCEQRGPSLRAGFRDGYLRVTCTTENLTLTILALSLRNAEHLDGVVR